MADLYLDMVERVILDRVYEAQATIKDAMPLRAYSALSEARLRNVRYCCEAVDIEKIPGALIECGVWRGGASMMMAACNKSSQNAGLYTQRVQYVCDSFEGLPRPSIPQDNGLDLWVYKELSVSEETVRANFSRLGLFDSATELHFVKGWFKDTLPVLAKKLKESGQKIAVLRADGDMYESTRNIMDNLYPLIAPGGFFIEDDYFNIINARRAVDDYRQDFDVRVPIERIDNSGGFWRVPKE